MPQGKTPMKPDDIIGEGRATREAFALKFGFDVAAMARDLRESEKRSGRRVVKLPRRRPKKDAEKLVAPTA
jgi:hypothetical protein